jgi:alcohol dehydrogenase (cytochrome c)
MPRVSSLAMVGLAAALLASPAGVSAQGANEWFTVNKDYSGQRYVDLDQITPANVGGLKRVCEIVLNESGFFTSGLLMVGRTIYVNTLQATYAIDAATCDLRWRYLIRFRNEIRNSASRGSAYLDGRIFFGTVDGRVIALDAATGNPLWDVDNADTARRETFISAPIAWDGKVFIGIGISDAGVRGRLMAFDAATGRELWRFYSIPMGNEPGADTWGNNPSVAPAGGGFWTTYSLDPATREVFASVANPYPDYQPERRPGANLYTNSLIALNAGTGRLDWYNQLVPHDGHDWDLGAAPALYRSRNGQDMLAVAGKDGYVHGIDRASRAVVFKTPGTTIANDGPVSDTPQLVCPGSIGGAQWNGAAYHPGTGALYVGMVDWCFYYVRIGDELRRPGRSIVTPIRNYSVPPRGWITAIDGESGDILWQYHADAPVIAGLVPTKSGLLFGGSSRGDLLALDARTGAVLHRIDAGGALNNGLISYSVDGTQYVAAAVGGTSMNSTGTVGPKRVSVFGLHGSDAPKVITLDRMPRLAAATPAAASRALYALNCGSCHGLNGTNIPGLLRQTQLAGNPEALKAFLVSVPPPMPRLYPGLLDDGDVELIAQYLAILMQANRAR